MALADDITASGYRRLVLLVPPGSDLASQLLARTLGPAPRVAELRLVDPTDEAQLQSTERASDPERTLFVVETHDKRLRRTTRQYVIPQQLEQEAA